MKKNLFFTILCAVLIVALINLPLKAFAQTVIFEESFENWNKHNWQVTTAGSGKYKITDQHFFHGARSLSMDSWSSWPNPGQKVVITKTFVPALEITRGEIQFRAKTLVEPWEEEIRVYVNGEKMLHLYSDDLSIDWGEPFIIDDLPTEIHSISFECDYLVWYHNVYLDYIQILELEPSETVPFYGCIKVEDELLPSVLAAFFQNGEKRKVTVTNEYGWYVLNPIVALDKEGMVIVKIPWDYLDLTVFISGCVYIKGKSFENLKVVIFQGGEEREITLTNKYGWYEFIDISPSPDNDAWVVIVIPKEILE